MKMPSRRRCGLRPKRPTTRERLESTAADLQNLSAAEMRSMPCYEMENLGRIGERGGKICNSSASKKPSESLETIAVASYTATDIYI